MHKHCYSLQAVSAFLREVQGWNTEKLGGREHHMVSKSDAAKHLHASPSGAVNRDVSSVPDPCQFLLCGYH